MTAGLAVFDTTVQETNVWLKRLEERLPPCSRQQAYGALRATLHVLRDRLPQEAVLALSAQLPMLLRGLFFEGWRPVAGPTREQTPQAFAAAVAERLPPAFPRAPLECAKAALGVIADGVGEGEARKLAAHLPASLRVLFPDIYWAA